jgi:hypothetical protein
MMGKKNGDDWAGRGVVSFIPSLGWKELRGLGPNERKGRRICGDALVRNLQTCRPLMLPSLSLQRALRMSFLTRKIRAWLKIVGVSFIYVNKAHLPIWPTLSVHTPSHPNFFLKLKNPPSLANVPIGSTCHTEFEGYLVGLLFYM